MFERQNYKESKIFHLLLYCPSGHKDQGWAEGRNLELLDQSCLIPAIHLPPVPPHPGQACFQTGNSEERAGEGCGGLSLG